MSSEFEQIQIAIAFFQYFIFFMIFCSLCKCCCCPRQKKTPEIVFRTIPEKYNAVAIKTAEPETCTICIEDFEEGDHIIKLACEHAFHPKCIGPWLEISVKCPNCKTKISEF